MRYSVDSKELKSLMFSRVMARVIAETPGMEDRKFDLPTNGVVANFIGLNYDNVSGLLSQGAMESETDYLLSGLINSIDKRVDKFMVKNFEIELKEGTEAKRVNLLAYRKLVGLEADEEKEENSDDNPFGETVTEDEVDQKVENDESTIALMISDLIKEIVKTGAPEVSNLAEKVIELSKQNLEDNKEVAEGDEDTFKVEKGSDEEPEEGEDKPKKSKKKKDKDDTAGNSDNPFEDNDNNNEGSEDTDKGTDNPFEDDSDEPEDDKTGEENENARLIKNLKCRSFGLEALKHTDHFYPFAGIENAAFNKFSKYIADQMHGENLTHAYNNFGVESSDYQNARNTYINSAKEAMNASIASILTAAIFNIPVEGHKLNHVELFA